MKPLLLIVLTAFVLLQTTSCGRETPPASSEQPVNISETGTSVTTGAESDSELAVTESARLILTVNDKTATVTMLDNDAVTDFLSMLPLELIFDDYNNTEKIATLPEKLDLGSAPTSCDPDAGTFAYYAPWGNLSVFYRDFRQSENLIPLGIFESGIDIFAETDGQFSVIIELEENK